MATTSHIPCPGDKVTICCTLSVPSSFTPTGGTATFCVDASHVFAINQIFTTSNNNGGSTFTFLGGTACAPGCTATPTNLDNWTGKNDGPSQRRLVYGLSAIGSLNYVVTVPFRSSACNTSFSCSGCAPVNLVLCYTNFPNGFGATAGGLNSDFPQTVSVQTGASGITGMTVTGPTTVCTGTNFYAVSATIALTSTMTGAGTTNFCTCPGTLPPAQLANFSLALSPMDYACGYGGKLNVASIDFTRGFAATCPPGPRTLRYLAVHPQLDGSSSSSVIPARTKKGLPPDETSFSSLTIN